MPLDEFIINIYLMVEQYYTNSLCTRQKTKKLTKDKEVSGGCALAVCWSYRIGIKTVQQHPKRRKLKKHGRPQQSLFAIGLDILIDGLREYFFAGNRRVFEVLISYLSPSPRPLRL